MLVYICNSKTLETIQIASKSKQLTTTSLNTRTFFNSYQKSTDETFPLILGLLMTPTKFMSEFFIKKMYDGRFNKDL